MAGAYSSFSNSSRIFSIRSLPNQELNGRITNVSLGKVLGGSSAVNGMAFHRGQAEDYDGWASFFAGKSDWHWKGILPYFKKVSPPIRVLSTQADEIPRHPPLHRHLKVLLKNSMSRLTVAIGESAVPKYLQVSLHSFGRCRVVITP